MNDLFSILANLASILTALIAAGLSMLFWWDKRKKRKRLEAYLESQCGKAHTVVHLMAKLGMSEAEILHASFKSRHVAQKIREDNETGLASQLLFEYFEKKK